MIDVLHATVVHLSAVHVAGVHPVLADEFTDGFSFIKNDGKVIGPALLAGSGVGILLQRVLGYHSGGDYIRNILIATPIVGTLLTGGSIYLNLFGHVV